MLQRLICALYRGHYWLTTRATESVWIEQTCMRCGKVNLNGHRPPRPLPERRKAVTPIKPLTDSARTDRPWLRGETFVPTDAAQWADYKAWADSVPCKHCGRTPEQQRAAGVKYRTTEDECSECFERRCRAKAGA